MLIGTYNPMAMPDSRRQVRNLDRVLPGGFRGSRVVRLAQETSHPVLTVPVRSLL